MSVRLPAADDADFIAKRIHVLDLQRRYGGGCPKWVDGGFPASECWCVRYKGDRPNPWDCPKKPEDWQKPDGIEAKDYAQ